MKVTYQNDQLLQLRPQVGWIFLAIGVGMVLCAPLWLWLLGQRTTLSCERVPIGRPQCRLSHAVLGYSISDVPLVMLTGAHIEQDTDSDGDTTYRLIIEAGDQTIPFTSYTSSNYSRMASAEADIQHYLTEPTVPSLTIQDTGTIGLVVSGFTILNGIGLGIGGALSLSTLWTFDRERNAVVKYRKTLSGPKMWQYTLSEMANAIVSSSRDSDGDRTYRIELQTTQGLQIPMTGWYSSGYKGKQRTADAINAFINQS